MELIDGYGYGHGYGHGYGDGHGYGYGYGDGYGDGYGHGDGYGDGCGHGYGYGYGDGYGYGYGYGDGYGDGYGHGDGYGYGYGSDEDRKLYFAAILRQVDQQQLVPAFWRSNSNGSPANGGDGGPRKVGMIEEISGPLKICTKQALHATLDPTKWKGDRWWIVGLVPPIQMDGDKIASLKRIIIADLGKCPF